MALPGATLSGLRAFAKKNKVKLQELKHPGGGTTVIVPEWGAKIVFIGSGEENCVFTSPNFSKGAAWGGTWNRGGIRTWLSPEGGPKGTIFSLDFKKFNVPEAMDPGEYLPVGKPSNKRACYENTFKAMANDGTEYHLRIGRDMTVAPRPAGLAKSIRHVGVSFAHRLKNCSKTETYDKCVDLWHLAQTLTGGIIVVPTKGKPKWRNYFQAIPKKYYKEHKDFLTVKIDGKQRFKLGVPNTSARTGIAYLMPRGDEAVAIIKRFRIVPGAVHCDKPQKDMKANGDPVQLYNHFTGGEDAFGEIECHSPSTRLSPGREFAYPIRIDVLEGPVEAVRTALGKLLQIDLSEVKLG